MYPPISDPYTASPSANGSQYGVAATFDFDNPEKWETVREVPLLDQHEMTDEDGRPIAYVGRDDLEEIARNNNRRVYTTGDPAPLTVGHTSDDPQAPERPVVGYVVNYKVKPFRRDENGQIIYAVHGDYKVRKTKAHVIEDFPRRSVELWWGKKELDPIALLGGTTPERDLSVVIRKSRFADVVLDNSSYTSDIQFKYSRRVGGVVLRYSMPGQGQAKVHKVMSEFKEGTLKSGSGHKVTNRDQAVAIAMSEAGLSRPDRKARDCDPEDDMNSPYRYNQDDSPPEDDFDDTGIDDEGGDGDQDADDPVVSKVAQSKWGKGIESKLDEILAVLTGGEGGEPGMGPDAGMGGEPGMEPGMGGPPPSGMEPPPPPGGMPPGPPDDERESRMMHGDTPPVRFEMGGSLPGSMNSYAPGFAGGSRNGSHDRYSRNGRSSVPQPRVPTRPQAPPPAEGATPEVVRLQRQVDLLADSNRRQAIKLARKEAQELVSTLKGEGILFGRTPEEAAQGEKEEIDYLSVLSDADRDFHVNNVIRKKYQRRAADPANPAYPGLARYARSDVDAPGDPENPEFATPAEATQFADLVAVRKMSRADALKFMRSKR